MQISIQENFFCSRNWHQQGIFIQDRHCFQSSFSPPLHHFSTVGLCLTVWLNVVSWLWKAMVKEYLGIHGYWRSAYCESCCFAAEMGDSSLEHTDMHRKTNSGNIFFICFLFICHLLLLWAQKTFTPSYYYCYYFFFAEIKDPIRGECPSTKIAALDINKLVLFLVYHPLCMYK